MEPARINGPRRAASLSFSGGERSAESRTVEDRTVRDLWPLRFKMIYLSGKVPFPPLLYRNVYFDAFYCDKVVNIFCLRSFKFMAFYQLIRPSRLENLPYVELRRFIESRDIYC